MPLIVSQIKTGINSSKDEIISYALKKLRIKGGAKLAAVHKTSLDARNNADIRLVSSVWVELDNAEEEKRLAEHCDSCTYTDAKAELMPEKTGSTPLKGRVVVAGFGPAGMFAALTLAEYGFKPLVVERGGSVEERVKAVEGFWLGGELDEETNVQFGEGGAGTFSDGKLTTLRPDISRRQG